MSVLHLLTVTICHLIPALPQPIESLASREKVLYKVLYKVADWQAGYRVRSLTWEDYLVVSISGRGTVKMMGLQSHGSLNCGTLLSMAPSTHCSPL